MVPNVFHLLVHARRQGRGMETFCGVNGLTNREDVPDDDSVGFAPDFDPFSMGRPYLRP